MAYSIKDVAKEAGVGIGTVSRTLNGSGYVKQSTRERVMAAVEKLKYSPNPIARNLSSHSTSIIAVLIPDITNPYYSRIVRGITTQLEDTAYALVLYNTNDDLDAELSILEALRAQDNAGVIFAPIREKNSAALQAVERLQRSGVPVLLMDRDLQGAHCDRIFPDNRTGAKSAVGHLLGLGHKNVAIIAGSDETTPGRERTLGWRDAYAERGTEADSSLVFMGDFSFESGREQAGRILRDDRDIRAIFCCNNLMTYGCLRTIQSDAADRDVDIVGFGDPELGPRPELAYIFSSPAEIGSAALAMLVSRIREKDAECSRKRERLRRIPTRLILS